MLLLTIAFVMQVSRFTKSVEGPYSGDPIEGPRVLADIVEAIVGAVYLDSKLDLEVVQKVNFQPSFILYVCFY